MESFEHFLQDKHAESYTGTDDDMPVNYELWVTSQDVDSLVKYADEWMKEYREKVTTTFDDFSTQCLVAMHTTSKNLKAL